MLGEPCGDTLGIDAVGCCLLVLLGHDGSCAGGGGAADQPSGPPYTRRMVDVTDATFQTAVIERSMTVPVVVDLWAEWCGPCKQLGPIIEKVVAATDGQVELAKVDVDANPNIAQAFRVQSIPAVFAISEGRPVDQFIGALPEAEIAAFVAKLLPTKEQTEVERLVEAGDEASLRAALELEPDNPRPSPRSPSCAPARNAPTRRSRCWRRSPRAPTPVASRRWRAVGPRRRWAWTTGSPSCSTV